MRDKIIEDFIKANPERYPAGVPVSTIGMYACDVQLQHVEGWLKSHNMDFSPTYQRGRVWTPEQKTLFIEAILVDNAPHAKSLYFNSPGFRRGESEPIQVVDGLQRLTTWVEFVNGAFKAYDMFAKEINLRATSFAFRMHINEPRKVARWYLQLNASGTPHTQEELERVVKMV